MLVNAKRLQRETICEAQQVKIREFFSLFFSMRSQNCCITENTIHLTEPEKMWIVSVRFEVNVWTEIEFRIQYTFHIPCYCHHYSFGHRSEFFFLYSLLPGKADNMKGKCIGLLFPITQTHINLILLLSCTQHYPIHGRLDGCVCLCVCQRNLDVAFICNSNTAGFYCQMLFLLCIHVFHFYAFIASNAYVRIHLDWMRADTLITLMALPIHFH